MIVREKSSVYELPSVYNQGGGGGCGGSESPIYINIINSAYSNPCYIDDEGFHVKGTNTQAGFSPKLQITEFTDIEINLHVYLPPTANEVTGLITKAPTASHFIQIYYSTTAVGYRVNNSFVNEFPKVLLGKENRIKITYNKTTRHYSIYIDGVLFASGTTIDFTGRDICVAFGFRDGSFTYHPGVGTIYYKDGTNIIVDNNVVFEFG